MIKWDLYRINVELIILQDTRKVFDQTEQKFITFLRLIYKMKANNSMRKEIKGGLATLSSYYSVTWLRWLYNRCAKDWCRASGCVSQLAPQG
ncbi:unnamed protein product [Bubo scandiacus]